MILHLLLSILNLKRKQIQRTLAELGIIRLIVLFIFYCFYQFFLFSITELNAFFVGAGLLSILSAAHSNRKDEKILLQLMDFPFFYYLFENFLWVLLFTWGMLFSECIYIYPLIITLPLFSSFLPTNRSIENQGFILPMPFLKGAYDWKAGMRDGGAWGIIVTIVLATLGVMRLEFLFVSIVVASLTTTKFYSQNEPRQILYAVADNTKDFLKKKIKHMVQLYTILNIFSLLIGLVFYLQFFYIIAYLFLASMFVLLVMVLHKYMTYEPNTVFKANSMLIGIYYISIFIPFLLPLPVIAAVRTWRRANHQLSYYF